jgi:hypothetical protein
MRAVKLIAFCVLSAGASAGFAPTALSQSLPKEGKYEISSCFAGISNVLTFSKTHSAASWQLAGTSLSPTPGTLFDKTSYQCVGMTSTNDGKVSARYVCETTDTEGAKIFTYWSNDEGKISRIATIGAGKYEGIELVTTVEPVTGFPPARPGTIQGCNRQTGSYKLKATN